MSYTADEIKKMDMGTLIPLMEKKLGRQLDASWSLSLALCHGGGTTRVIDLNGGGMKDESINYDEMANLLNGPDAEWICPYTGPPIIIKDPAQFVQTFLFALSVSPKYANEKEEPGYGANDLTPIESLVRCFQDCGRIAKNYARTGYHFVVSPESPYSFYFECLDAKNQRMYNGGIICHGAGEVFAVELSPSKGVHWSIHT